MDQRWRTGRLSGTRREREGFNPCYLAHRGFRARWTLYPVHIINARLEFPWKRHVGTMRFHVSSICATTLLFREGRGEREWGERIYIYIYLVVAALCFADRIGDGPLSLLSRHICDRIRSVGKNATYCAKSIWPSWLLLFFGDPVPLFFTEGVEDR